MCSINIISDFTDYYDVLKDDKSCITYKRMLSESKQRATALKELRRLSIKTLDIKSVNQFTRYDGPIVVYTNPNEHHGLGKRIMTVEEAQQSYSNCVASQYIESSGLMTIKFLQIGKRRFSLMYKKANTLSLDMGTLIDISESSQGYNNSIALPIYSIDYISVDNQMVATDFNEVENLGKLQIDRHLSKEDIINEIRESLLIYNKA